jgi:hypothetical protein
MIFSKLAEFVLRASRSLIGHGLELLWYQFSSEIPILSYQSTVVTNTIQLNLSWGADSHSALHELPVFSGIWICISVFTRAGKVTSQYTETNALSHTLKSYLWKYYSYAPLYPGLLIASFHVFWLKLCVYFSSFLCIFSWMNMTWSPWQNIKILYDLRFSRR